MGNANAIRAGRAFVEFFIDDKRFSPVLSKIESKLRSTGTAVQGVGKVLSAAGGSITAAFAGAATAFATTGAALDDMSKRTGVGVTALSELKFAAEQSGTNLETVEKAIRGMQKFTLGAARGTASMTQTLSDLGLSLEQIKNLSPEQQFQTIAAAIAKVPDPSTRAALAMKVFGKAGSDLLPLFSEGPAGFAALSAEAHKLGVTLNDEDAQAAAKLDDAIAKLKNQFGGLLVQIGGAIAGPLTDLSAEISNVVASTIQWIGENQGLVAMIAKVGAGIAAAGVTIYALGTAFNTVASAVGVLNTALTLLVAHPVIAGVAAITATIGYLVYEFYKAHDAVTSFDEALQGMGQKRTSFDADELTVLITRYDQLAAKAKLSAQEQEEARQAINKLRTEFGDVDTFVKDGRIVGADKARAQLSAAQRQKSRLQQRVEISLAEGALNTRIREGDITGEEIDKRKAEIARKREDLARTERIVADAGKLAPGGAVPPQIAAAAATANANAAAAVADAAPPTAATGANTRVSSELVDLGREQLSALQEIARNTRSGGLIAS